MIRVTVKVRFVPFFTQQRSLKLGEPTLEGAAVEAGVLEALGRFEMDRKVRLLGIRGEFAASGRRDVASNAVSLPLEPDPSFDYRTANKEATSLARASLLEGRLLGDIAGASFTATEAKRGKGEVGAAIERFFGMPPNSRQEANFTGAGIELKVVPLRRTGRGIRRRGTNRYLDDRFR